jgi:hypothetical protein
VVHLSRSPHGGLAVGVGAHGAAVWMQREPRSHRWRFWRTRTPDRPLPCGDDWGFGSSGVREPRVPSPHGGAGAIALPSPDDA